MPKKEIVKRMLKRVETKPEKSYNFYEDIVMGPIDKDISRIPELYAFWAIAAEEAQGLYELSGLNLEKEEADFESLVRRRAFKRGEKLTEGAINNKKDKDISLYKKRKEVIENKKRAAKLKAGAKALLIKADLLRTKAANKRQSLMPESVMAHKRKTLKDED